MFRSADTNYPAYDNKKREYLIHFPVGYADGAKKDELGYITYSAMIIPFQPVLVKVKEGSAECIVIFNKNNKELNLKFLQKTDGTFVSIDDDEYEEPDN